MAVSGKKSEEVYRWLMAYIDDNKFSNERKCLQTVIHQNFHGFIIDGVKASLLNPNLDCYQEIYRRRIPTIFYNNYYKNLRCPRVIVNDRECADQLLGLLIEQGHRLIAGIFVYDNYQSIEKFQGTAAAMQKRGVEFQDDYIKWCVSNEAHAPVFPVPSTVVQKDCPSTPPLCAAIT